MTVWFDMDGVLCDLYGEYTRRTGHEWTHGEWPAQQIASLLRDHPNLYRELPWIPGAHHMLHYAETCMPGQVGILSSESSHFPGTTDQKLFWIHRNAPTIPNQRIVIVKEPSHKLDWLQSGDILVDDNRQTVEDWCNLGEIGILFTIPLTAVIMLDQHISPLSRVIAKLSQK